MTDRSTPPVTPSPAPSAFGSRHEQVVFCHDEASGLKAIIAIYSTALGPALGGTRFYPYASEAEALTDVLNLSQGMAYKNALAGLDLGGGKAVIIGDPATLKTEALLRAYGRFVQSLNGRYFTACDVGTFSPDMDLIARESDYVTGRTVQHGGAGDSSVLTAFGVYQGMRASAQHLWGDTSLAGKRVGVAGVGKVGRHLVGHLIEEGAHVVVTDPYAPAVAALRETYPSVTEVPDQVASDLADAGHADAPARQRRVAPQVLGRGPHALVDAERRQHRRVAGTAVLHGAARHVVALARDQIHVGAERPDVAGREVAAVQRLHEASVGAQQGLGLERRGIADDDGLAAAQIQAGEGVLVGHAL